MNQNSFGRKWGEFLFDSFLSSSSQYTDHESSEVIPIERQNALRINIKANLSFTVWYQDLCIL